jgi:mono/diheme cytochrome c family protein
VVLGPLRPALLALILLVGSASGCRKSAADNPWAGVSGPMREKARRFYEARCENCHGKTGAGDGPEAKKSNPPPRSFHVEGWQRNVTNAQIEKSIVGGGAAIGKSVVMPPNPDLADRPELVRAMRAYVRHLASKKP